MRGLCINCPSVFLALTSFEAALRFVDYVNAALTAHNTAIAMALLERTERVTNFHVNSPSRGAAIAPLLQFRPKPGEFMVGGTGIEPVATTMST